MGDAGLDDDVGWEKVGRAKDDATQYISKKMLEHIFQERCGLVSQIQYLDAVLFTMN